MGKKRSSSSYNFWIRAIGAIILSYIAYRLLLKQRDHVDSLDLDPILPPSGSILKSIAIPRVSGSIGISQVRSIIKSQFPTDLWNIEEDSHVIDSPHGPSTTFTNLIFTLKRGSDGDHRVILAAHYDSKLLESEGILPEISVESLESQFIGATDSAWSCALMIGIGKSIQKSKSSLKRNFQLIFFDGEEAVRHWSSSDSLYGSRALASKWSRLPVDHFNSLKRIDLMVLLDLLGSRDANVFYSFHPEKTVPDNNFRELIEIESVLFPETTRSFQESKQFKEFRGQAVEDDHTPFLPFGVPVLHLIPIPFPQVWHKFSDTIDALDRETCHKLSIIIYEFIKSKIFIK